MSKKLIVVGGKYLTRSGRKVRVLATDVVGNSDYPVIALYTDAEGNEHTGHFTPNGSYYSSEETNHMDLIEVVEVIAWTNVYPDSKLGGNYSTKLEAQIGAGNQVIGQLKTTIINGGAPTFEYFAA